MSILVVETPNHRRARVPQPSPHPQARCPEPWTLTTHPSCGHLPWDDPSCTLQDWSANPMFERKDNKKEALLDLDGRMVNLNKRYTAVKDAGLKIQAMVMVRTRPEGALSGHSLLGEEGEPERRR